MLQFGMGVQDIAEEGAAGSSLSVKTFTWTSCVDSLLESTNLHVQNNTVMLC